MRIMVDGMQPAIADWQGMLVVMAVLSLAIGNLAAIMQTNIKRMLAYSTISHMGFLLLGVLSGTYGGYTAGMFYVITYVLTTLAVFGVIMLLARQGFESEEISDLAGLNQRSPLYAGVMAVGMFSLAGVPPLVGFYAKLVVLETLLATQQTFLLVLAVFAVLVSLVGAFYYLRIVKVMYFEAPPAHVPATIESGKDVRVVLSINGALVLGLGLLPGGLMTLCSQAMSSLVKSLGT
jgi:NADH-quinone oxidoreductase subunit N